MGWFNDQAPRHGGYIIGVRAITTEGGSIRFRALGAQDDDGRRELPLRIVQVGCDCGWRSQRLRAPYGTTSSALVVFRGGEQERETVVERKPFETVCRELWREHALSATDSGARWRRRRVAGPYCRLEV
jgi:hypothetical protein